MAGVVLSVATKETTNYARLCRLLVDIGSQALRDTFDGIHAPATLHRVLASHPVHITLQALFKGKKKILNPTQWFKLYPAIPSSVSSANFDITLLMVLLRNICGLTPPATGWDALPPETDKSREADIARLKYFRNIVYAHEEQTSVDNVTFNRQWHNIRSVLMRLGGAKYDYETAIDKMKTECMDPVIEEHFKEVLQQWKKNEYAIKDQLQETGVDIKFIEEMGNDIKYIKETLRMIIDKPAREDTRINSEGEGSGFHPNIFGHENNGKDAKGMSEREGGPASSDWNTKELHHERNEMQTDFKSLNATASADQNRTRPLKLSVLSKKTGNFAADIDDSSTASVSSKMYLSSGETSSLRNIPNVKLGKSEPLSKGEMLGEAQTSRLLYQNERDFKSSKDGMTEAGNTKPTAQSGVNDTLKQSTLESTVCSDSKTSKEVSCVSTEHRRQYSTEIIGNAQDATSSRVGITYERQPITSTNKNGQMISHTAEKSVVKETSPVPSWRLPARKEQDQNPGHTPRNDLHNETTLEGSMHPKKTSKDVEGSNPKCKYDPCLTAKKIDAKCSSPVPSRKHSTQGDLSQTPAHSSKNDPDTETPQKTHVKHDNAICDMCGLQGTIICRYCFRIICRKCKHIFSIDLCGATKGEHAFLNIKENKHYDSENNTNVQEATGSRDGIPVQGQPSTSTNEIVQMTRSSASEIKGRTEVKGSLPIPSWTTPAERERTRNTAHTSRGNLHKETTLNGSVGSKGHNPVCELCDVQGTITCGNCHLIICRKCKKLYEIDLCGATKGEHAFVDLKDSKVQQMKSVDAKASTSQHYVNINESFEDQEKDWPCSRCTYLNPPDGKICVVCATTRGVGPVELTEAGGRVCRMCTYHNKENAKVCQACHKTLDRS